MTFGAGGTTIGSAGYVDPNSRKGYVVFTYDSPNNLSASSFPELQFRWLIVPAATLAGGRLKAIDWQNYDEVKQALQLAD
ncbi:hypothetical protein GCM10023187_51290 [Nibrella viscosa]|uniref:Uncharacterized protein n=2 Tax=Nibrella viscosa TaxID=1084524 RepID=A0ABP8KWK1_9BACT